MISHRGTETQRKTHEDKLAVRLSHLNYPLCLCVSVANKD
jgi:hypothetical protein